MSDVMSDSKARFKKDITFKSESDPPPWSDIQDPEYSKKPPWVPYTPKEDTARLPAPQRKLDLPSWDGPAEKAPTREEKAEARSEGASWVAKLRRWWACARKRRHEAAGGVSQALLSDRDPEMGDEERRVRRITPSCYNAMEIHGFYGLVDDGPCSSGRMLIVHQPSWVRGQFLDIRDGDDIHVWHVAGRAGGVLRVLSTGRHRYYSPGQRVTTCTVCVPEEQWERLMQ